MSALSQEGLFALLREAYDELAAHAVALGTVTKDYASTGDEESDEVTDLLARMRDALKEARS